MRSCKCASTSVTIELIIPLPCLHETQQMVPTKMPITSSRADLKAICDDCASRLRAEDDGWIMGDEDSSDCHCPAVAS